MNQDLVDPERAFAALTGFTPPDLTGKVVLGIGAGGTGFLDVAARWGATAVQADLPRLPLREGAFDAVYAIGAVSRAHEARELFLRLPPLLKEGGDIAVSFSRPPAAASLLRTLFPWFDRQPHIPAASVLGWCRDGDIRDVRILDEFTSIRGRRDSTGALPLVRWTLPDLRTKRVLVFGAGEPGRRTVQLLRQFAPGSVMGIVDNDPARQGRVIEDRTVRPFEEVSRDSYDVIVVASRLRRTAIAGQLNAAGLVADRDYVMADRVEQWIQLLSDRTFLAA